MRSIPLSFFLLTVFTCWAEEKPALISLKTKIIKPQEWYADQARLWKESLENKPSAEAWLNYYMASKYGQKSKEELAEIVAGVTKSSAQSFEAYVIQSWDLGYSEEANRLMNNAYTIAPDHPATFASLILLNEFQLNASERKKFSELLWETNQVSASLLSYTYNLLMSLENDAILFTEGDNTTIPIFVIQDVFHVRNDVKVLNLDMMLASSYRGRKLKQIEIDLDDFTPVSSEFTDKRNICGLLPLQNPRHKFYCSLTLSKQNISEIKDQLYVVGLASQISKQRFDNISFLKENLEKRFLLDHLTVDFEGEDAHGAGRVLSANYLVPMLLLSEHYMQTGEKDKLHRWETLITKLAEEHGKSVVVQNFLRQETAKVIPFVPANLNIKALEGSLRNVKDNIYALKNEVTNDDYNFYLKYLSDNKREDLYEVSKIDLSQYEEPALSFMKAYHTRPLSKKERAGYPVVNISQEGAIAYCDWLTEQYNNNADRKYKKVKFRLPSVNEWQVAALGYKKIQSWNLDENSVEVNIPKNNEDELCKGCKTMEIVMKDSDILYPWFGSYNYRNKPVNKRGCALGNFKWPENQKKCLPSLPTPDGWILMSPVESYFPNQIGLSDVVGNVAEMTLEKGKACGGSWNHLPEESTIRSINEYKGPDAAIGFRVFMEIIER